MAARTRCVMRTAGSRALVRAEGLEERVLAFAEQLGRIAGTVQAKTAGWIAIIDGG
jgi:hypothetical protein